MSAWFSHERDFMKCLSYGKQKQICNKRGTVSSHRNTYSLSITLVPNLIKILSKIIKNFANVLTGPYFIICTHQKWIPRNKCTMKVTNRCLFPHFNLQHAIQARSLHTRCSSLVSDHDYTTHVHKSDAIQNMRVGYWSSGDTSRSYAVSCFWYPSTTNTGGFIVRDYNNFGALRIRIVYLWNAKTAMTHQDLWLGN